MAQKFIITNTDKLRLGNVEMHRELLRPDEDCLGGGFYEFDYAGCRLLLSGKSYDFGRPKWNFIDVLSVPEYLSSLQITYEDVPLADLVKIKYE